MSARRRNGTGDISTAAPSPRPLQPTPQPPQPKGPVPRWFCIYYWTLCTSIIIGVAIWFIFFFQGQYHPSHVAYDPMRGFPSLVRDDVHLWYQKHGNNATADAPVEDASKSIKSLLSFLVRFKHADFFSPEGSGTEEYYEHFVEAMTTGWLAGVFEGLKLDESALARIESERQGVGSIPGGSRRLNEQSARIVSPIVSQLYDGDFAASTNSTADVPTQQRAGVSNWSILTEAQQNWVYAGLAQCHTTPCRLAKMQLALLWKEKLTENPAHPRGEQWKTITQSFHPDSHSEEDSLLDAPASAQTLANLWFRFFGSGDVRYVQRIVDLTVLTGAPAYQSEKDREVAQWHAGKERRRVERMEAAKAEAQKSGTPFDAKDPAFKPLPPLPPSPTQELHRHFFNSLVFYGSYGRDGKGFTYPHESVRKAIHRAWMLRPEDKTIRTLMQNKHFSIDGKEGKEEL